MDAGEQYPQDYETNQEDRPPRTAISPFGKSALKAAACTFFEQFFERACAAAPVTARFTWSASPRVAGAAIISAALISATAPRAAHVQYHTLEGVTPGGLSGLL